MNYTQYFKGKKITVMGLGLLGRGIGVAKFLAECGAQLTITDLKTKDQLAPSLKQLAKYKIKYVLGEHKLVDFQSADMVIKAAGVPLDSLFIAEAVKNNIPVEMDASLLIKLTRQQAPSVTFIGITGTRGKSTVTHLVYEILKTAGKKVYLGGNIRGQATLPLIKKLKAGDMVVLELDSWQLQGFDSPDTKLDVAVFTNLMNDHQNYYKNDMVAYFADKANIYRHQTKDNIFITNQAVKKLMVKNNIPTKAKTVLVKSAEVADWSSQLLGEHNRQNLAHAIAVARALGISDTIIKKAIKSFSGLPGRMELVSEVGGVKFYNDTNGTTPDAVLAALEALQKYHGKIILLGGGADKNLDYSKYVKVVPKAAKVLILFKGAATEKIISSLPKKNNLPVFVVENMKAAFDVAKAEMKKGDVVLLSPGAASFGVFKNEYDRGDQFVALVQKLK